MKKSEILKMMSEDDDKRKEGETQEGHKDKTR